MSAKYTWPDTNAAGALTNPGDGILAWTPAAGGGGGGGVADPTSLVGLAVVNGSGTVAMRSNAAPALSQAINPYWTGQHTFASFGLLLGPNTATWWGSMTHGEVFVSYGTGAGARSQYIMHSDLDGVGDHYGDISAQTNSGVAYTSHSARIGASTYSATTQAGDNGGIGYVETAFVMASAYRHLVDPAGRQALGMAFLIDTVPSPANPIGTLMSVKRAGVEKVAIDTEGNLKVRAVPYVWPTSASTGVLNCFSGTLFWAPASSGPVSGNPTATIGLSAVNGVSSAYLRADGAPALSQAINPTWTGSHTYAKGVFVGVNAEAFWGTPITSEVYVGYSNVALGDPDTRDAYLTVESDGNGTNYGQSWNIVNADHTSFGASTTSLFAGNDYFWRIATGDNISQFTHAMASFGTNGIKFLVDPMFAQGLGYAYKFDCLQQNTYGASKIASFAAYGQEKVSFDLIGNGTLAGNVQAQQVITSVGTVATASAISGTLYYDMAGPASQITTLDVPVHISAKNVKPGASIGVTFISNGVQNAITYDGNLAWFGTQVSFTPATSGKRVSVTLQALSGALTDVQGTSKTQTDTDLIGNPIQQSDVALGPTESPPPFRTKPAINIPKDGSSWQRWNTDTQEWE